MTKMESYFILHQLLVACWKISKEDWLAGVLGSTDPTIFLGGMPMDTDFFDAWSAFFDHENITRANIPQKAFEFLEHLEKIDPYYSFPKTKPLLLSEIRTEDVLRAEKEAERVLRRFHM